MFTHLSREETLSAMLERLEGAPRFDIEASLKCNLDCIMCPREKISREIGIMSPGLLKGLPDWLHEENAEIFFRGMGEPTLNKGLAAHLKTIIPHMPPLR